MTDSNGPPTGAGDHDPSQSVLSLEQILTAAPEPTPRDVALTLANTAGGELNQLTAYGQEIRARYESEGRVDELQEIADGVTAEYDTIRESKHPGRLRYPDDRFATNPDSVVGVWRRLYDRQQKIALITAFRDTDSPEQFQALAERGLSWYAELPYGSVLRAFGEETQAVLGEAVADGLGRVIREHDDPEVRGMVTDTFADAVQVMPPGGTKHNIMRAVTHKTASYPELSGAFIALAERGQDPPLAALARQTENGVDETAAAFVDTVSWLRNEDLLRGVLRRVDLGDFADASTQVIQRELESVVPEQMARLLRGGPTAEEGSSWKSGDIIKVANLIARQLSLELLEPQSYNLPEAYGYILTALKQGGVEVEAEAYEATLFLVACADVMKEKVPPRDQTRGDFILRLVDAGLSDSQITKRLEALQLQPHTHKQRRGTRAYFRQFRRPGYGSVT